MALAAPGLGIAGAYNGDPVLIRDTQGTVPRITGNFSSARPARPYPAWIGRAEIRVCKAENMVPFRAMKKSPLPLFDPPARPGRARPDFQGGLFQGNPWNRVCCFKIPTVPRMARSRKSHPCPFSTRPHGPAVPGLIFGVDCSRGNIWNSPRDCSKNYREFSCAMDLACGNPSLEIGKHCSMARGSFLFDCFENGDK